MMTTRAGPTRSGSLDAYDDACCLFIAEKPQTALRLAEALSALEGGRMRARGAEPLCTYDVFAYFPPAGRRCNIAITSACGHLYTTELTETLSRETRVRGLNVHTIFRSKAKRVIGPTSAKLRVREHLQREAHGRAWICLWFDCDREGEAIGFEVLRYLAHFTPDRVWRARFSSLAPAEVLRALRHLVKPNPAEAAAAVARQELDLKIGLAFSRLLTRCLCESARRRFVPGSGMRMLPYAPCAFAALRLCVTRLEETERFRSTPFHEVFATIPLKPPDADEKRRRLGVEREHARWQPSITSWPTVDLAWTAGPTKSKAAAMRVLKACTVIPTCDGRSAELMVRHIHREVREVPPPVALNTVGLLRLASSTLGLAPQAAMALAEDLYKCAASP